MYKLSTMLCIQSLGCISTTLHFASLWGCHREGFLLICSLFVLLLLQQGTRRNSGTASQIVLLKSAHPRENKFEKNLRLLKKAPKAELKPFCAGPTCQWLHNQHGCIVQIQLPSFQPAWAGSPEHSPLGRKRCPLSFFRHLPCEGRHNTGYLWQTHSSSSQRRTLGREPHFKPIPTWGWLMGLYPSRMKGEHWGFSSVLWKAAQCEASDRSDEEKGVVSQAFFLYIYSEDVVFSMPTENNTHFENSGFELLSLKWETKPQET